MKKRAEEDEPYTSNYPPLQTWLEEHKAQCMWEHHLWNDGQPTTCVAMYLFQKGAMALIITHSDKRGWKLMTSCGSNKVADTLADAEARMGLEAVPKRAEDVVLVTPLKRALAWVVAHPASRTDEVPKREREYLRAWAATPLGLEVHRLAAQKTPGTK